MFIKSFIMIQKYSVNVNCWFPEYQKTIQEMSLKDCRKLKKWMSDSRKIPYDIAFEDIPNANSFCLSACFSNKDLVSGSSHSLGEKRPLLFNVRSMLVLVWPKHETTKNGEIKNRKIKALIVLLTHIIDWHIITRAYNCINKKKILAINNFHCPILYSY